MTDATFGNARSHAGAMMWRIHRIWARLVCLIAGHEYESYNFVFGGYIECRRCGRVR